MPGPLHQAANRYTGVARRRMDRLAEFVANGLAVKDAGIRIGLTKGETARTWANIKAGLGRQAS